MLFRSQAARAAVRLDSTNPAAHYLLGWELARRSTKSEEAIDHLEYAARWFPEAHYTLAALRAAQGNFPLARRSMELYAKIATAPSGARLWTHGDR